MRIKFLFCSFLLAACVSAQADWFLRGTHNSWAATPMVASGTNTMAVKNVVFNSAGSVKFDRFGDWSQNYGVGGRNGGNIPVAAGTWDIKFFTDTKGWQISRTVQYHLRGTHNAWAEGDLMTLVPGSATQYQICRNFGWAITGNPRFKVDPSGGWGADAFPAADYPVTGWAKITVDGSVRKIVSVETQLLENCAPRIGVLNFANPGPFNLQVGDTLDNPIKATHVNGMIAYSSSNPAIATVAGSKVTIIIPGSVTITARGLAGAESAECIRLMCFQEGSYVINASLPLPQ